MADATPAPKPGFRWKRAAIAAGGVVALLLALVALAPTLLSWGVGRGMVEGLLGEAVNGSARIDSMSLSWFGQQQVNGLELQDRQDETRIRLDIRAENSLFSLLVGRIDSLRVDVSGSVQAQLQPGGGTSLSNLASAGSGAPAKPAASQGDPLAALRFPVRLTIGSFDLTLSQAKATAFAVKGLKGSVSIGRDEPLAIDLAATTQVDDRSGALAVKGSLEHFLDASGAPNLQGVTGQLDAQVTGWLAVLASVRTEVQAAALRVQAPAGKPIGIGLNASLVVEGGATTAQAQMTAARPAAGRDLLAWASDPRTWIGQVTLKGVSSQALQRFVAQTPLVLARDVGPTIDASVRTGEGAGVDLSVSASNLQLSARATVDAATGAMQGEGITLQTTLDPRLLASLGTTVDAPVQVSASVPTLRTPPIPAGGSLDLSAITFDASLQVQPFQMLQVAPQPIAVGALAVTARAEPLGTQLQLAVQGSVQQAPIDVQAQVTGLGRSLAIGSAQVRGTVAAGPLDPSVLPGLPASARQWVDRVSPGATTVRASLAGSLEKGAAQAQVDMAPGSVALKGAWDAQQLTIEQAQGTLALQPSLVTSVAGEGLVPSGVTSVQWSAGPVRVARSGATAFEPVPVSVRVDSLALAKVPGLPGSLSARGLAVQGALDPDGPTLFDGTVTIASALAPVVDGVGSVQVREASLQAKLPADMKQVDLSASIADVQCPRVPSLSASVGVRDVRATLRGPIDLGAGASASFQGTLHDAQDAIATLQGTFEPQGAGAWKASLQSGEVDVRRALALAGQGEALPEWVGSGGGSHTLAVALAGNAAGISFSVNAALDPVTLQAQGTRSASGSITLSKAQAKAVLPASVMRSIGTRLGSDIVQCDPMRLTVAMNALTLPVDATGALQPFAAGSDIDFTVHLDPWKVQARQSPTLAFGANDLVVKSKAGTGALVRLTGSLGAEGTPAAPLSISVRTAQLLDASGRFAPGQGSIAVTASMKDFPTALADRLSGMDGYLIDMLGPTFTVSLDGRSGSAPEDFFKATFTSPTLTVSAPVVRLSDRTLRIAPDAPLTAELRPDDRFRERILRPVNPFLADLRTTDARPIRATLSSLQMPVPVDTASLDAAFKVDVGLVDIQKSSQFLGIMDLVKASQSSTVPGLVSPLDGTITQGVLSYRDFKVQVGRLGTSGWQQTLFSDARIDLRSSPAVAEPITIRYPASSVTNVLAKIPGMQGVLTRLNKWLGGANDSVQQAVQVKVSFSGPLDGSELKMKVSPELDVPPGVGDALKGIGEGIQQGIGNALGDLFGGKKGN